MENWLDGFEHESLNTPEAQQSFKSAMGKYKSQDEALIGGFNAIKEIGKPFKLPESMDKIKDENVRNEFKSQAFKVLGIEPGVNDDSLKEINWLKGAGKDDVAHPKLVEGLSKFAKEKGYSKTQVQDLVELNHKLGQEMIAERNEILKQATQKSIQELEGYFGKEELKANAELVRRAFKNHGGLSEEEYGNVAEELTDELMNGRGSYTKAIMNMAKKLEKEGTNPNPGTGEGKPVNNRNKAFIEEFPIYSKVLKIDAE